ncbi:Hsp70 family protein [Streptomyces virginiae]|uniref:Hsp70 family protein n=1 Tax=Streptomyces virginiae TaxID=1961 RepID=UPI0035DFF7D5
MPRGGGWGLAVDIGGAFVKSAYWDGEGGIGPLPVIPATVLRDLDGRLLTGPEAVRLARTAPERAETMPLHTLTGGDGVLLGGEPVASADLVAALLTRVARDAWPGFGRSAPAELTMVVPARWGLAERQDLGRAVAAAGLPDPRWVPAPLAVASCWSARRAELPLDTPLAVCDAGATGLRIALVRHGRTGHVSLGEVASGGHDLDEALFGLVEGRATAVGPDAWRLLLDRQGPEGTRARALLREDLTGVRETLSASTGAALVVPGQDSEFLLRRAEFEEVARRPLHRAAEMLRRLVAGHGAPYAVLLAGGAARTPLLSELLADAVGTGVPDLLPDPVNATVLGAARLGSTVAATEERPRKAPYVFAKDGDLFK